MRAGPTLPLALLMIAVCGAPCSAATRVVFTIDVESNAIPLPDQVTAVCTDGQPCGLLQIARVLQSRGWSGTFFLSAFEQRKWGDDRMRAIAQDLQAHQQDVALHTHPDAYDPTRPEMYEYSLDEQTAMIRDGVRLLQSWTGQPVVAHRAGAYSADANTMLALKRNGILIDSSLFWSHPKSRLTALPLPRDLPSVYDDVIEYPVTSYERQERPDVLTRFAAPVTVVRKVDVNWFSDRAEMQQAIAGAVDDHVPVLIVFLHSFSLIDEKTTSGLRANTNAISLLRDLTDEISAKRLSVVSMRQLAAERMSYTRPAIDPIPIVSVQTDVPRYLWHRMKASRSFFTAIVCAPLVLVLAAAVTAGKLRRRRESALHSRRSEPEPA